MIDGIELAKQILKLSEKNNGYEERLYCKNHVCNRIGCPMYDENGECNELMIKALVEYINSSKNFDHYIVRNGVHITKKHDVEVWEFRFKKGTEKQFFDANIKSVLDWLLAPYEEPKPKYKLTQFEYDLLASVNPAWANENNNEELCDFGYLTRLIDKDYFKDIPTDVPIGYILDNCEVIQND